jgi:hypothetical protein
MNMKNYKTSCVSMEVLLWESELMPKPALPTGNGTYILKLTVLDGVNTFSWILDS